MNLFKLFVFPMALLLALQSFAEDFVLTPEMERKAVNHFQGNWEGTQYFHDNTVRKPYSTKKYAALTIKGNEFILTVKDSKSSRGRVTSTYRMRLSGSKVILSKGSSSETYSWDIYNSGDIEFTKGDRSSRHTRFRLSKI